MTSTVDSLLVPIDPSSISVPRNVPVDVKSLWASARTDNAKPNTTRTFYEKEQIVSVVSLGSQLSKKSTDARNEALRAAVGTGVKSLLEAGAKHIGVASTQNEHVAAEGALLGAFDFTLKTGKDGKQATVPISSTNSENGSRLNWNTGSIYASAQNLARELAELPANMITPTAFCERIKKEFADIPDTEIIVHDEEWAREKGMRTFLSVTKGTDEPAKFLEILYNGAPKGETPLAFVGKGITFDSGGISLKPAADMKLMRGDMGGAAAVASAALGIAKLKLPINLVVAIPLCENLPGPSANKPGDIIYAMNGKSVEVDNTDAEGRLVLADALYYTTTTYRPHTLVDVATLTGAVQVGLGHAFSGVFSNSDSLWDELNVAGEAEYDRFWRMPLDDEYGPQIYGSNADLCNTGGKPGGCCTAALFLKAFVDGVDGEAEDAIRWAHIDIGGSMDVTRPGPYQRKGMTGRPTRGLIEFTRRLCEED
ncbi:hypothetical protein SISSUDRAFT_1059392 [Sistotremastrum suecicum HHB10207 ss-3]|uniref:Cytosol aminopeptidase domain-containing protein n=1 Tax=Sistotremastrum suecicum HHB10207 ss-3 TaxID=1314776 RepID=A0A166G9L8_9AGAM|nr:hypothetical protein SISSUDRAFT_1059392 [Sistotremastrum suecicum HHB10207 ss-3]